MSRGGAMYKRTQGGGGGKDNKMQWDNLPVQTKWGGKDGHVRRHMTRGQDDWRGGRANEVEESRIGNNHGNIHQQE